MIFKWSTRDLVKSSLVCFKTKNWLNILIGPSESYCCSWFLCWILATCLEWIEWKWMKSSNNKKNIDLSPHLINVEPLFYEIPHHGSMLKNKYIKRIQLYTSLSAYFAFYVHISRSLLTVLNRNSTIVVPFF